MRSFRVLLCTLAMALFPVSSFHVRTSSARPLKTSLRTPFSQTDSSSRPNSSFLSLRGGSNNGITRTNPLHAVMVDALAAVNNFYMSSPYVAAALTCGTKASAADYVAQRRHFKKREETTNDSSDDDDKLDTARNIAFLIYGSIYQGMAQEYIYNHLYPAWFGTGSSPLVVLSKVLFDLLIQTTLVTLPIAYLTKAAIFRYSPKEGLRRYWQDITTHGLLTKYFMLWGPVQCVTFSIVPEHLRVSFIAVVSFFWLIILSSVSARPRKGVTATDVRGGQVQECELKDGITCNIDG